MAEPVPTTTTSPQQRGDRSSSTTNPRRDAAVAARRDGRKPRPAASSVGARGVVPARRVAALVAAGVVGAGVFGALALVLFPEAPARAVSTRSFRIDQAAEFGKGELDGASARSDGAVVAGVQARRVALPDVALAYAVLRGEGNQVFIGTGNDGKVFTVAGDRIEELAGTGQLVVSSLALGPDGVLFAGTLPEARIFRISTRGGSGEDAPEELAVPEGAEHVWDLVWDDRRNVLFAATGPDAKVWAIDPNGNASVWWEGKQGHVMALALEAPGGALYAGTDGEALVVRLDGPGQATVVGDFPGNEITAVAVADGVVAVAANEFPDPPRAPSGASSSRNRPNRPKPGKGSLHLVLADGRTEQAHSIDDNHYTDLAFLPDGDVLAATGAEGRIYRVAADGRTSATWVDVDERQVLGMDVSDADEPLFVTGDVGALYRVRRARPPTGTWTSEVLDARFPARFGALDWQGTGGPIRFETRSGNTERPDDTWSPWSRPLARPGPIPSPGARYLQLRATLADPDAVLLAVEAFFLPQNQRARVQEVGLDQKALQKRRQGRSDDEPPEPSSALALSWTVANPDGDRLRYRLRYRPEGGNGWREILRPTEVLDDDEYVWDTTGVPDGRYVIEVEASDELANPRDRTLDSRSRSEPLLVDNHAPRIEGLAARGGAVVGRAVDTLGPIAKLEVAIDGEDWRLIFPVDDLLDTANERFRIPLDGLPPGEHIVAVRATDAGGNAVTAELNVRTR